MCSRGCAEPLRSAASLIADFCRYVQMVSMVIQQDTLVAEAVSMSPLADSNTTLKYLYQQEQTTQANKNYGVFENATQKQDMSNIATAKKG